MALLTIRQSGGTNIISIPKEILNELKLHTGSRLDLNINKKKHITLVPVTENLTLENVLAGSPKKHLKLTEEDQQWFHAKNVGKEI
jgi:antitoxin ChpS